MASLPRRSSQARRRAVGTTRRTGPFRAMSSDDVSFVKNEANTFADRAFQVSFGYFAVVGALLAGATSDRFDRLLEGRSDTVGGLLALAVLVLDAIYLTVALGCLF